MEKGTHVAGRYHRNPCLQGCSYRGSRSSSNVSGSDHGINHRWELSAN